MELSFSPSNDGKGKLWATDAKAELPIRVGSSGPAAEKPITVFQLFNETRTKYGNKVAFSQKRNNAWKSWTWQQYYNDVIRCARAMLSFGLKEGQSVNILGFNSPEWFIADLAAIACGGIAAGIYTSNNPDACQYISEHSDAHLVFVENEAQLKKFLQVRDRLPLVKAYIQWGGTVPNEKDVYSWEDFMKKGDEVAEDEVKKRIEAATPGKCCTLIYTSGTTGPPKAVMISHDNATWTARAVVGLLKLTDADISISYLPLSHIAAQMLDLYGPMTCGCSIFFAQPDALKGSLSVTLKEVRPTIFLGVPRVWEKFQEKMLEAGRAVTGLKRSLADWAKSKGLEGNYNEQQGKEKPWGWWFADKLVFSAVKERIGFDRIRYCATAAAPISKETLDYFLSLNIPILEIFGMSECSGPATVNVPGGHKTGTCGRTFPGAELKTDEKTGEICMRGRHVFMGYMKNDKATAETIDTDGWLHSGDVGNVDKDGFLTITGRIKELLITAGGENIPPVLIEDEIKRELGDVIANVMVVGDRKKFLSAILTVKAQPISEPKPNEYPFTNVPAEQVSAVLKKLGCNASTVEEAIKEAAFLKYIEDGIRRANKRATSNAQVIQKFILIEKDFSVEGDELTATLKLRRKEVLKKYGDRVEKLYADAEAEMSKNENK